MPSHQVPTPAVWVILALLIFYYYFRSRKRRRAFFLTAKQTRYVVYAGAIAAVIVVLLTVLQDRAGQILAAAVLAAFVWYRFIYVPGRRRIHAKGLGEFLALTPIQFEVAVGQMLRDNGYRGVRRMGKTGDLSADLWCRDRRGQSVVVQCKRYAPGTRIGSGDIQAFIGMMSVHHRANRGIFVTTTDFTEPAIELAKRHNITLVDGHRLTRLAGGIPPRGMRNLETEEGQAELEG